MDNGRFDRINELIDALEEEEKKYQVFLDASPWGILVVDKTFRIVYFNKTLERMSGYQASELRGEYLHALLPEDDRKRHVAHEKTYTKNPHNRMGNHGLKPRLLTKTGGIVPVEISLSPTKVGGRVLYFASIRPLESLFNTVDGVVKTT